MKTKLITTVQLINIIIILFISSSSSSSNNNHLVVDLSEEITCQISESTGEQICSITTVQSTPLSACQDLNNKCSNWANDPNAGCYKNSRYMMLNCKKSCGVCKSGYDPREGIEQKVGGQQKDMTIEVIDEMHRYMNEEVFVNSTYSLVRNICKNEHQSCALWAAIGECDANPSFMLHDCAVACKSCLYLDINHRCPMPDPLNNAYESGDLNKMFNKISHGDWDSYRPKILSAPKDYETIKDKYSLVDDSNVTVGGSWVVVFEEFLTANETDRLIQLGYDSGYERSSNVGSANPDGTFKASVGDGRTSYNAWCLEECHPVVQAITHRIAEITGIPEINSEYLQLLKYDVGQYYEEHHDYIQFHLERPCGPRLLTFFLYLSDVEEGGGTKFSNLNLVVEPKKGKALLWPNTYDHDPSKKDSITYHEALPVLQGKKYAANAWLHLRDFKTPMEKACS